MRLPRRVFLNPCDYLLHTDHVVRMRGDQGPNIAFMCMDIDGALDAEQMRRSIARAMAQSPTTLGLLRHSIFGGWPFWRIPRDPAASAEHAVNRAYQFIDASDRGDVCDGDPATTGENPDDLRNGPQIRMTHYALPAGKSRVCIRWPHWLMDAAGTLAFLALWAKCYEEDGGVSSRDQGDVADVRQWRPLQGISLIERWRTLRSQPNAGALAKKRVGTPCDDSAGVVREHRVMHRLWDADAMERIRKASKHGVPAGPARITRYLAVSVLRALHELFKENGWGGETYRITLPMRMRGHEPENASPLVFGNHLVSPLLLFDRRMGGDASQLAASLMEQLHAYLEAHGDRAQWTLMSLAALLPFPAHRWIFGLPSFKAHFSSGFSFYGELHPPLRSVAGMPITNLYGGGPTTIPPGMNPVFSRFDASLNLALTYSWPVVSDDVARRYVELIEAAALA
ncbi:MAG: hypothetical protein H6819_03770 [Phycisphaerales bacterium]|nr:hypothetical protein [Phycisphaerales bacterium]MCB9856316.1 hypothetical protein [Phycisphaerales bacterium]MCB9863245.1 hypothetical protein [Phycisphaerales bacterium]